MGGRRPHRMMGNPILIDNRGFRRAQLWGGEKGRPKTGPNGLSRAPCKGAASTPTAQDDGQPNSDRQEGFRRAQL